ncbi:MAG: arsenite efflux transporter metallochaperone ArsD [Candidatus Dormibacteria bacterium]
MTKVEVFDPAMCCPTGVCGPSVDPRLARFASDLDWLAGQGVTVARATLSQEPEKFVASVPVREALNQFGDTALPAVLVDGRLRSTGRYPTRAELAEWASVPGARLAVPIAVAARPDDGGGCDCGGSCS